MPDLQETILNGQPFIIPQGGAAISSSGPRQDAEAILQVSTEREILCSEWLFPAGMSEASLPALRFLISARKLDPAAIKLT